MNSAVLYFRTTIIISVLGVALLVGSGKVLGLWYQTAAVVNGGNTSSRHFSDTSSCHSVLHPFSWNHSIAYSANTSTANRTITVVYLDFYNGSTNPSPVPNSSAPFVWSLDSFIYGNGGYYHFGNIFSTFKGQPFNTYDITLWMWETFSYNPGGNVYVDSRFGESDGSGGHQWTCGSMSQLVFDPPN